MTRIGEKPIHIFSAKLLLIQCTVKQLQLNYTSRILTEKQVQYVIHFQIMLKLKKSSIRTLFPGMTDLKQNSSFSVILYSDNHPSATDI